MEMRRALDRIAGVADVADQSALRNPLPLGEARGIVVQMRVIIRPGTIVGTNISGDPAAAFEAAVTQRIKSLTVSAGQARVVSATGGPSTLLTVGVVVTVLGLVLANRPQWK